MPGGALDRLVEVWAADNLGDGYCGSGWVLGGRTVLTASHVLRRLPADGGKLEVRRAELAADPAWYACRVVYRSDADLGTGEAAPDLALLEITDPAWQPPRSPRPRLAEVGTGADRAEAIGFPESQTRTGGLRVPEQASGVLLPGGQPRRGQLPFDVQTSVPSDSRLWAGMSGAAVRDGNHRIVGVVKATAPDRQQRRLFVTPVAALAAQPGFRAALRELAGNAVIEVAAAPSWRHCLEVLAADGAPPRAADIELGKLGVKEPRLLSADGAAVVRYVRRDLDDRLDVVLSAAVRASRAGRTEGRMVLVLGDSGAGKSRAAAEALRGCAELRDSPVLVPRPDHRLAELADAADRGELELRDSVLWLDDVQRYLTGAGFSKALADRLITDYEGLVVIATINRGELDALEPAGDRRPAGWDLIGDTWLIARVPVDRQWSPAERADALEHVTDPGLRTALDQGIGLPEWLIAGPELVLRLRDASYERRTLAWLVINWHRTGRPDGLRVDVARSLWTDALSAERGHPEETFDQLLQWCQRRVLRQALVSERAGGLAAHDYVLGEVARAEPFRPVPDGIWAAALSTLDELPDPGTVRLAMAEAAYRLKQWEHLDAAIDALRRALALTGEGQRDYLKCVIDLARALSARVEAHAGDSDTDEVIALLGRALTMIDLPVLRHTRGYQLMLRYLRKGGLTDLTTAVQDFLDAVANTPPGDVEIYNRALNAAWASGERFDRTGGLGETYRVISVDGVERWRGPGDLVVPIQLLDSLLVPDDSRPPPPPQIVPALKRNLANLLVAYAVSVRVRPHADRAGDLSRAIDLLQQALAEVAPGSQDYVTIVNSLFAALETARRPGLVPGTQDDDPELLRRVVSALKQCAGIPVHPAIKAQMQANLDAVLAAEGSTEE
jgi:tetratricopeptide (TPR) repeat protein